VDEISRFCSSVQVMSDEPLRATSWDEVMKRCSDKQERITDMNVCQARIKDQAERSHSCMSPSNIPQNRSRPPCSQP
jgi:hypothetical protein